MEEAEPEPQQENPQVEAEAEPRPPYSIRDAMVLCGVDNTTVFEGKTPA